MVAKTPQQYCVAIGSVLLMAGGLVSLAASHVMGRSAAMSAFEASVGNALLLAACAALLLGITGAASVLMYSRCVLCTHALAAIALCVVCSTVGVQLLLQVSNDATRIDRVCEQVQAGGSLNGSAAAVSAQQAYDELNDALADCRLANSMALRLDACKEQERRVAANPYVALFRDAEDTYSCSGFCQDGMPMFGLPAGSVNEENKGVFRTACFVYLTDEVRSHAGVAVSVLLLVAALPLGPAFCACWLVCAPPPLPRHGYAHRPEELEWIALPQDDDNDSEAEGTMDSP